MEEEQEGDTGEETEDVTLKLEENNDDADEADSELPPELRMDEYDDDEIDDDFDEGDMEEDEYAVSFYCVDKVEFV